MNLYKGKFKKKNYFEGWYFKNQKELNTISVIPGINIDIRGKKSAFIQVISNKFSDYFEFDFSQFKAYKNSVCIGNNYFSDKEIKLDINNHIKGSLYFSQLTPIKYDIMGPFKFVPFMECKHRIISLMHKINGNIKIGKEKFDFNNGIGYIESDFGRSFPKSYLWLQCTSFKDFPFCFSLSVADIPFFKTSFKGLICIIYYNNKEYRLSTYNGVKIIEFNSSRIVLKQGKYNLTVDIINNEGHKLFAPQNGNMTRIIRESLSVNAKMRFYIKNDLVLNLNLKNASYEFTEN